MDDTENTALNTEGDTPDTTPVSEDKATGDVTEPTEEATADTGGEESETGESSKKGANQRIRELAQKARSAEDRAQSLAETLQGLTGSSEPSTDLNQPFTPQIDPDAVEISPEQYKNDVMRAADGLVQLRIKQQDAVTRINNEANNVLKTYPKLDPDSESFDKELSDAITEATEAHVRSNPYTASVKNIVDKLMKPYERAVSNEVGKVTENVAKQVSEAALRPTSVTTSEKKFEDLSIGEMEKKLGFVS